MSIATLQVLSSRQAEAAKLCDEQLAAIVGSLAAPVNSSAGTILIPPKQTTLLVIQPKDPTDPTA